MRVVATAGHVDHGKSTLVRALTGTDPDRWAEEKARGLTIDLGFAHAELPSGAEIGFVDVPGHVRFLKNMLAGVGAVDACLFVVAATEGWKPQSEEHLRILQLLGLRHGVIALTKVGALDRDWLDIARLDVSDHLQDTFLENSPIVEVDALNSSGMANLVLALENLVLETPPAPNTGRVRLWVDRAFSAKGSGTICTGTLTGGSLHIDHEIEIVGHGQIHAGRIRALQTYGTFRERLDPGCRAAVNLAGVSHHLLQRGDALVQVAQWSPTAVFDATLEVLQSLGHEVSRRGAFRVYLGSGEHPAKMRVLGPDAIQPGENGLVRLWLPNVLPLLPGDRYILREAGRSETVGGGEVLDVAPVLPASKARPNRRVDRVIAERQWVEVDLLERLTGVRVAPTVGKRWVVDPIARQKAVEDLTAAVISAAQGGLELASLEERLRTLLGEMEQVEVVGGVARLAGASKVHIDEHPFLRQLRDSPYAPPAPESVNRTELRDLVRAGLITPCDGVYFATSAIEGAATTIAALLKKEPNGVTVSQVREALGTSRKFVLPLLAHLDSTGMTRRRGDLRVSGPLLNNRLI